MTTFTIKPYTKVLSWLVTLILVTLNLTMVGGLITDFLREPHEIYWKILVVTGALALLALLLIVIAYPLIQNIKRTNHVAIHAEVKDLDPLTIPNFNCVAVALDFSRLDQKLIAFAIGQGNQNSSYVLIHVVESATARVMGNVTDDLESRKDEEQLDLYVKQLAGRGYNVTGRLGYRGRKEEIVNIVKEVGADLLVMGAHGHAGVKDWLYGATINQVRHELKIPVLIVHSH